MVMKKTCKVNVNLYSASSYPPLMRSVMARVREITVLFATNTFIHEWNEPSRHHVPMNQMIV